jgi:hypothetical protein
VTDGQRSEHVAARPTWDCRNCGNPWPCATAKTDLLHEFRYFPSVLAIYMTAQMCEALDDLTFSAGSPPSDLYERFMSWQHPTTRE